MAKITINIDQDLLERLEQHLKRSGQTKTFAIGQAIGRWLDDEEPRFSDTHVIKDRKTYVSKRTS